jgi:hypothetical protein
MSVLSTAQRAALPASSFADPARRKYPIVDASDVRGAVALLGKAPASRRPMIKANIMRIARSKGFASSLPASWTGRAQS